MNQSLTLQRIYHDVDVVEVRLRADNGKFRGEADIYLGQGQLAEIAESLVGFPLSSSNNREIAIGGFGAKFARGAAAFRLFCADLAGHPQLELRLEADYKNSAKAEGVTLIANLEAAAVDRFVIALKALNETHSGFAVLEFVQR